MKTKLRRSGFEIMLNLLKLLGSLFGVMILAIINGCFGFISAMGVTFFGVLGIAKFLGENIPLSYSLIIALGIISGIIRGLLRYFEQYANHYIAFKLLAVLRDKIFASLRVLCPAKLESKEKGSIISMITSDIETLEVFYAHTISPICIAILVSSFVVIFVGKIATWYFSLLALLAYVTIGIIVPIIFSRKLLEVGVNYRKDFSTFNSFFLDSIKGIKEIIYNNNIKEREYKINILSNNLLEKTKIMKKTSSNFTALCELLITLFDFFILALGIYLVINNSLSIGKMLLGLVTVLGSFGPVLAISALPRNLNQTFASGDRVLNLLSEKPETEVLINGEEGKFESLEIENLSFSYPNIKNDEKVLKDISLSVKKGEIVGILGESGCGKSTLLKLILRFWKKDNGFIKFNNIDIENIKTHCLLENVTMVSQDTYLFDSTIRENLKIAKQNASDEEIIKACKMASIHDFIKDLPKGYETQVGLLAENLSAGEKQRIGLARAFLTACNFILLDEPTSNVDSLNEKIILSALKKQKKSRGIILVSHRKSTMAIADKIYSMKDGKISLS